MKYKNQTSEVKQILINLASKTRYELPKDSVIILAQKLAKAIELLKKSTVYLNAGLTATILGKEIEEFLKSQNNENT
jgi:hypothetical protein